MEGIGMPDYTDQIDVAAPADAVFAFISDVSNLPRYLPTVHDAQSHGADRVEVDGTANGHRYASTGWFNVDPETRSMRWGSDGQNDYAGQMAVTGDGQASQVTCTLRFSPAPEIKDAMDKHQGGPSAAMTDGLRASLRSIKQIAEGTGGKVESSAAE